MGLARDAYFDYQRLPGDIGYIRIGRCVSNYIALIHSVDRALGELWNTRGLIIEVRSSPSGIGFITDTIIDRFCSQAE